MSFIKVQLLDKKYTVTFRYIHASPGAKGIYCEPLAPNDPESIEVIEIFDEENRPAHVGNADYERIEKLCLQSCMEK